MSLGHRLWITDTQLSPSLNHQQRNYRMFFAVSTPSFATNPDTGGFSLALVPRGNFLSPRHQIPCHLSQPTYLFALDLPNKGRLPIAFLWALPWDSAPFVLPPFRRSSRWGGLRPWAQTTMRLKKHWLWSKSNMVPNPALAIISHMSWGELLVT